MTCALRSFFVGSCMLLASDKSSLRLSPYRLEQDMYYWYMQKDVRRKHPQGSLTKIWYPKVSSLARNGTLVDKGQRLHRSSISPHLGAVGFFFIFAASQLRGNPVVVVLGPGGLDFDWIPLSKVSQSTKPNHQFTIRWTGLMQNIGCLIYPWLVDLW